VSKILDIFIVPKGFYITLFRFFQIGIVYQERNKMQYNGKTFSTKAIDLSISIWRFGIHIHPVISRSNICQDVILAKS
jgi:hypothetical protein